jgi:plasmid replication initiation protein
MYFLIKNEKKDVYVLLREIKDLNGKNKDK